MLPKSLLSAVPTHSKRLITLIFPVLKFICVKSLYEAITQILSSFQMAISKLLFIELKLLSKCTINYYSLAYSIHTWALQVPRTSCVSRSKFTPRVSTPLSRGTRQYLVDLHIGAVLVRLRYVLSPWGCILGSLPYLQTLLRCLSEKRWCNSMNYDILMNKICLLKLLTFDNKNKLLKQADITSSITVILHTSLPESHAAFHNQVSFTIFA